MTKVIINNSLATIQDQLWFDFHGSSIFTTLRTVNHEPMLWPYHYARLIHHGRFFNFSIPKEEILRDAIRQHSPPEAKVRILVKDSNFALTFDVFEKPPPHIYDGVTIIFSTFKPHPQLGQYKTVNYLPYSLAHQEALREGVFEALLLNDEGYVVDGSRTSILLYDGTTLTALLGGLLGCMREAVLAYSEKHHIPTVRKYLKPEEIKGQILLANSLIGVVPVGTIASPVVRQIVQHFKIAMP